MAGGMRERGDQVATRLAQQVGGVVMLAFAGCLYDFGDLVYEDAAPTSTSAASATTTAGGEGGATTSSGLAAGGGAGDASGGGGPISCLSDADCPTIECYDTACQGAACVITPLEQGAPCGPDGAQTCTASNDCVACVVVEDCASPLSACRTVACLDGACVESPVAVREACIGGPGVCTAAQTCVECIDAADCRGGGNACIEGSCGVPPPTCSNGLLDEGEPSIDCGGICPRCPLETLCTDDDACDTSHCDVVCAACEPGDCLESSFCHGGTCIPDNGEGVPCSSDDSCASGHCVDEVCCNQLCVGLCVACRASSTGSSDGTCAVVVVDRDPGDDCEPGPCATGACDGAGRCGLKTGTCTECGVVNRKTVVGTGTCSDGVCGDYSGVSPCPVGAVCSASGDACDPPR